MALFWIIFGSVFSAAMIGAGAALGFAQRNRAAGKLRRVRRGSADSDGAKTPEVFARLSLGAGPPKSRFKLLAKLQTRIEVAGLDWRAESMLLAMLGGGAVGGCI